MTALLDINGLSLTLKGRRLLDDVRLHLEPGKIIGLVGASGSGKSLTARSIIGLPPKGAHLTGNVLFDDRSLLTLSDDELCHLRGRDIGIVFQDSSAAFDPLMTIGDHIVEPIRWHLGLDRDAAVVMAKQALDRAEFPANIDAFHRYPHEISGGQRQRAMIAVAIALSPKLLLADEPTTALDVTTEASIFNLFRKLAREEGIAIIVVSHDLPAIAMLSDHIALIEAGRIVEETTTSDLMADAPPRLAAIFASSQPHDASPARVDSDIILRASHLSFEYRHKKALDDVSFSLRYGECLGIVGQSGSGKSTLARIITGLATPLGGNLEAAKTPCRIQMVFQDPMGSLNPRWTLGQSITEPLHTERLDPSTKMQRVINALQEVGLDADFAHRYPHQVSGGQAQRAAIARAIINRPDILVLDEPVSALDIGVRSQILDLLDDLRRRYGLAMIFITHDLGVARGIANHLLVMQHGRVVEEGATATVLADPKHAYTRALVEASPALNHKVFAPRPLEG
jgi:peptide/nickel transport system ATP-binding protein